MNRRRIGWIVLITTAALGVIAAIGVLYVRWTQPLGGRLPFSATNVRVEDASFTDLLYDLDADFPAGECLPFLQELAQEDQLERQGSPLIQDAQDAREQARTTDILGMSSDRPIAPPAADRTHDVIYGYSAPDHYYVIQARCRDDHFSYSAHSD